jgi:catechol 2,3-dioxygenase-like lactoylglutathione lyase family enzyme
MNLNQITIKSQNVNRAVQFYQQLGMRLIVDSSPRYVRFETPAGDSTFSISHSNDHHNHSTTLYFEVDDVNAVYQALTNKGIKFITEPQDQSWLWREASLQDPDGHPLIIFTAGINRKHPPWRLTE